MRVKEYLFVKSLLAKDFGYLVKKNFLIVLALIFAITLMAYGLHSKASLTEKKNLLLNHMYYSFTFVCEYLDVFLSDPVQHFTSLEFATNELKKISQEMYSYSIYVDTQLAYFHSHHNFYRIANDMIIIARMKCGDSVLVDFNNVELEYIYQFNYELKKIIIKLSSQQSDTLLTENENLTIVQINKIISEFLNTWFDPVIGFS